MGVGAGASYHDRVRPPRHPFADGIGKHRGGPFRGLQLYGVAALVLIVGALVAVQLMGASIQPQATDKLRFVPAHEGYRAFEPGSWWNTPLPADAPLDPNGALILHYLRSAPENGGGCLQLAGAGDSSWGTPIYWARPSDPSYDVTGVVRNSPPELHHLRIPPGAEAAPNSDGTMIVYDVDRGYVTALTDARYHSDSDSWTASGATVTYLDSNGLDGSLGRSDDSRNGGSHRGNNGATMAVRLDEVMSGGIRHVLKVASGPELADRYVFPMVGSDGDFRGDDPAVPPEGLRLRIKPSVDLTTMHLSPEALVIAEALQRYGFYFGDSGGSTALKLESTIDEGRGQLWQVDPKGLCDLPFTPRYWDVVRPGYDPSS